ncbi:MAG: hypothetical protein ONB44_16535 [candidate division KSB1 bacterium]|nr:hypothetical protein [candidate division KSB1 bacterium]MDZ7303742.1 hypothetical protein [candidate division KSB1 bacterium]MDZ7313121.1 hypothetical protein [candidate division KSB1 bacterium]
MKKMLVKAYDAPVDNKKRVTIRGASFSHYHIEEYSDGTIFLKPRALVDPNILSKNTLRMLDKFVANLKRGRVSKPINLDKYAEERVRIKQERFGLSNFSLIKDIPRMSTSRK